MNERTVLVIDDEPSVVNIIKLHLEANGYRVFTAFDGEEGLRQAHSLKPGLILLDVNMPKKGGLEFFKDILVAKNEKMFPVLVLTGRTEFEALFKDLSADGFIPKPIDFNKLIAEVDKIFLKIKCAHLKTEAKSVLIIEDDDEVLDSIVVAFIRAKFTVSGVKAVEDLAVQMPPRPFDLVLVKLPLCNVVSDFKRIPHLITNNTIILLYTFLGADLDIEIMKKLCKQSGVTLAELLEVNGASDLLKKSKEALWMKAAA